jgi:hypothetical protein
VAGYLQPTNFLPNTDAEDVNVDAAIAVSFNQPVVALGEDESSQPEAFTIQPGVKGNAEWINTSTYIFYPEPGMTGGMEYTVTLNPELKTVTGVSLALNSKRMDHTHGSSPLPSRAWSRWNQR